ncbi:DUF4290 domain-containing protein [Hymenobacter sp. 5516J-16]|uniref:DUF4290 domain-containing protein n=1 Tax=Hymenobacter sublimis TaxID=2933777 RepID=A0ABY4JCS0_9BACT|nr:MULTISPECIES: DUF4290 domain-containing protein [Hymenobacter]UOQ76916.1 DUF4290 domain-containing protein [Hymenobacter sp. 5516J-16]UPL50604.1 DUF4290 domain-containing protein [Hymenobacter sublimis]
MTLPSLHKHELLQREYGQSTFQLVQQLRDVEDRTERTRRAQQIVQLIFRIQPTLRDQPESQQKVWNHLFEMADGELDVDAPFPLVAQANMAPPQRVTYPSKGPKLRAYGRAVEQLIEKAITLEDATEREQATIIIGRTMKFLYRSHNKENAKDVTILKHLKELSGGQLTLDPAQVDAQNLFEFTTGGRPAPFIVPQPRQERDVRRGSGGNNNRRDKQRRGGKKGRQEPQQPPQ